MRVPEDLMRSRILHTFPEELLESTQSELETARTNFLKQRSLKGKLDMNLLALANQTGKTTDANITAGIDDAPASLCQDLGEKKGKSSDTTRSTPIPLTSSADPSILPIVTGRRDQFRARNGELEEELQRQFHTISELQSKIKSLQGDNLKLYEKMWYTQSHRESSSVSQLVLLSGTSKTQRISRRGGTGRVRKTG